MERDEVGELRSWGSIKELGSDSNCKKRSLKSLEERSNIIDFGFNCNIIDFDFYSTLWTVYGKKFYQSGSQQEKRAHSKGV